MSLKESLKERGIRLSKPRLMVLEFFENNPSGHFSINEIYENLKKQSKNISFTSVYRTCKLLERLGYIKAITFEERHVHYESNSKPHLHIQCIYCGKREEREFKNWNEILKILPVDEKEYLITSCNINILGVCKECKEKINKKEE
ncbi:MULTISPECIES: Fur family transcriptional regulator [Dictyoglomus]|jgi:Fe2+ or Zn2+ uptake regulation protein|uniref:Ferric uptake regulator, Fur family n=1 Tax=Dictyoglomus turgidum (strain DSM 6724 / Z-1310) TaxID=515635 RepID=B8E2J7_DICTD|nr:MULTISPECIES: Fur family transcriptional regulator [Dictyoglomus]ACK42841.1 ferric uptake regulator, Fur family [Dictyoglomus turgidum DSM 6724]HBU30900.1 transcriptional repressor [Dictyoglomus sp.]